MHGNGNNSAAVGFWAVISCVWVRTPPGVGFVWPCKMYIFDLQLWPSTLSVTFNFDLQLCLWPLTLTFNLYVTFTCQTDTRKHQPASSSSEHKSVAHSWASCHFVHTSLSGRSRVEVAMTTVLQSSATLVGLVPCSQYDRKNKTTNIQPQYINTKTTSN